jgi:hypothetical protein
MKDKGETECEGCENAIATYKCVDCGRKLCEDCAEGGYAGCDCGLPQFELINSQHPMNTERKEIIEERVS